MRRRLSTALGSGEDAVVNHASRAPRAGPHHGNVGFLDPRKEKPGGGNAGSDLFVIGVYGFKYAAWLLLVAPEGVERMLLLSSQFFFLFFYFLVLL
jgi:hypothetical protein